MNREALELMRRRPVILDEVRSIIFPSSLEASGDRSLSPDASGPDSAERKASSPSAARPVPAYAQQSPSDSQIAETLANLQIDSAYLRRSSSAWPLTTRVMRRLASPAPNAPSTKPATPSSPSSTSPCAPILEPSASAPFS